MFIFYYAIIIIICHSAIAQILFSIIDDYITPPAIIIIDIICFIVHSLRTILSFTSLSWFTFIF